MVAQNRNRLTSLRLGLGLGLHGGVLSTLPNTLVREKQLSVAGKIEPDDHNPRCASLRLTVTTGFPLKEHEV